MFLDLNGIDGIYGQIEWYLEGIEGMEWDITHQYHDLVGCSGDVMGQSSANWVIYIYIDIDIMISIIRAIMIILICIYIYINLI